MSGTRFAGQLVAGALLALALVGCTDSGEDDGANVDALDVLPADESVATPTNDLAEGVIDTPPPENAIAPNPDTAIPAALHGRWGLTAEACAAERDDAPGLVTVAADRINFSDAIAVPQRISSSSLDSIEGEFAFAGPDRRWTRPMIWSVEGRQLVAIDRQRDSRLVYRRC